jgi:hypothetical protein
VTCARGEGTVEGSVELLEVDHALGG